MHAEVGRLEQLERGPLEGALGQDELQHEAGDVGYAESLQLRRRPDGRAVSARWAVVGEQAQRVGQHVEDGVEALDAALRRARRVEDDRVPGDAGDAPRQPPERAHEAHGLGQAGRLAVDDRPGALRREVAGREAGAAGRDDQAGEAVGQLDAGPRPRCRRRRRRRGGRRRRSPRPAAARRGPRPSGPRGCRATTPSETVSTLAAQAGGVARGGLGHAGRRYRSTIMPSVSASWGSRRRAARRRAATAAPAASSGAQPGGVGVVDRLGRGQRAHAVDEHAARAHERGGRVEQPRAAARPAASTSPASMRQRASGRRRSAPRPEHGASTRTRSKRAGPQRRRGGRRPTTTATGRPSPRRGGVGGDQPRPGAGCESAADDVARRPPASARRLAARRGAQVGDPLARPGPDAARPPTATPGPGRSRRPAR